MSEPQDKVKLTRAQSQRPSEVTDLFNVKDPTLADPERCQVVLRQLTEGGEFSRTVKCSPGSITVLPSGREARKYEAFRQALLGRAAEHSVAIRLGSYDLHTSEIHNVGNNDVVEPGTTVREMLSFAGAVEASHEEFASAVGLSNVLDELTENLPQGVVTRLAITCAICSRCRIVFVDAPFTDVGGEWVPALANFMLQSVIRSSRIIMVTGVEQMPRIWKSSPFVETAGVEVGARNGDAEVVEETMVYLRKIRHLIGTAHSTEDTIFTYPQRIFRTRTPSGSGLRAEAIENPNYTVNDETAVLERAVDQGFQDVSGAETAVADVGPTFRKRRHTTSEQRESRQSSGRLTRVSKLHRLRNASTVRRLRSAITKRGGSGKQLISGTGAYRVEKAREAAERRRELHVMLIALILIIAVLLLLNWL